jgi:hypothetical protein
VLADAFDDGYINNDKAGFDSQFLNLFPYDLKLFTNQGFF